MAPLDLIVVGAGVAGCAAAWRARQLGASVRVVSDRTGSSSSYSGIVDLVAGGIDERVRAFAAELGLWQLAAESCHVATPAGVIRRVAGADHALLALDALAGRTIGVLDAEIEGFHAELLAQSYAESPWARRTNTRFVSVRVALAKYEAEKRFPSYDVASLHDEPSRAAWLCERLAAVSKPPDAWLVGPWLGVEPGTVNRIRSALARPVGEVASRPGEAAGKRLERARDALLGRLGIVVEQREALAVTLGAAGLSVDVAGPLGGSSSAQSADAGETLSARSVVLALGGVAAGGVNYAGFEHTAGAGFRLSLAAPVAVHLDGIAVNEASSMFGFDVASRGVAALERVGIAVDERQATGEQGLFAAGDCVAGTKRAVLEAVRQGIAAAEAALGQAPARQSS